MIISKILDFRRRRSLSVLLSAVMAGCLLSVPVMAEELPDETAVIDAFEEEAEISEAAAVPENLNHSRNTASGNISGNTSGNSASRNSDGSWNYTVSQQEALSYTRQPDISFFLENTDADLDIELYARSVIFFNRRKSKMRDSIVDLSRSTASINGTYVNISKVVIKNYKRAYVPYDSLFAETISGDNLDYYSEIQEAKKPCYYLKLDSRSAPYDVKKAVREANKVLRDNPVPIEVLPIDITPYNLEIDYNFYRGVIKRLLIYNDEGKLDKLRFDKNERKDFSYSSFERQILITGTNNYNGSVVYDPSRCFSFE